MKRSRLTLTVVLMLSSIALLIVLQAFWLKDAYERKYLDLRRESDWAFKNAVLAVRDSLVARNIQILPEDSVRHSGWASPDSTATFTWEKQIDGDKRVDNVQIFASHDNRNDSLRRGLVKTLAPRLSDVAEGRRIVIMKMTSDSISKDSVAANFRAALQRAEIDLPFRIIERKDIERKDKFDVMPKRRRMFAVPMPDDFLVHVDRDERPRFFSDTLTTPYMRIEPMTEHAASITGTRLFIVKGMAPQILFSLFLTTLTGLSFLFLYRSIREQQRLAAIKNDFINNVTHELKTPVATVSVALEALKNFHALENPKLARDYLDIAQGEVQRLSAMTDKILTASVERHEQDSLKPEPLDLDLLIQQVIHSMKVVAEKKEGAIHYNREGTDFVMAGEKLHLANVVSNLLDNAMKYTPNKPMITVSLKNSHDDLLLTVRDNGIGIATEHLQKIFEKFFRVPTGDVHTIKGYGLGLHYVANVVTRHGGKIKVESNLGKGSEFVIILPRQQPKADV